MAHNPPPSQQPWYRARVVGMVVLFGGWCYCLAGALPGPVVLVEAPGIGGGTDASLDDGVAPVALPEAVAPTPADVPTVLIDPGHGGTDPGTIAGDSYEKTWTLPIALGLAEDLRKRGWPVELTRTEDVPLTLAERSAIANSKPRLAFVSIHLNSGGPDASGVEVYYSWPRVPEVMARLHALSGIPVDQPLVDDRAAQLAALVQDSLCASTGAKNRGVRNNPDFSVTRRTVWPGILVEAGFLTNAAEGRLFATPGYRQKVIKGLADGIDKWLRENQRK